MSTPLERPRTKALLVVGVAAGFVALADGLAMLLPGPTSAAGGLALVLAAAGWLVLGVPRLLSPAGRPFAVVLVARLGLVAVPVLCGPVAAAWWLATPDALGGSFVLAWGAVFLVCVAATALWRCPRCGRPFGRAGPSLRLADSRCAHCGADARGGTANADAGPEAAPQAGSFSARKRSR